ncbi:MAG TPA: RsmE family RNA methyltransferase [Candidatus Angelobacter sp.]|nr:RsmE family RNA methyltransferase [Candidatus Angelobacter sp.]
MTRRRWIADRVEGDSAWLSGQNALHLIRVLRVKPGQQFDIAALNAVRLGTVVAISEAEVEFALGPLVEGGFSSSSLPVSVYLSIFKFDRLEWAIEKLTELGVERICPMIARRTEAHLAKAAEKRVERWRTIAREAAQQSRRVSPPEIAPPVLFGRAIQQPNGYPIVLSEMEREVSLKMALQKSSAPFSLAFGPEGGWTEEERKAFHDGQWTSASLGGTILRAETAAIAAVAIASAEITT